MDAAALDPSACRILVMASGNGSNFQSLVDAIASGRIQNAKIERLVVNRSKAFAIKRAEQAGIPWEYFNMVTHGFQAKGEKDENKLREARENYDRALAERILGGFGDQARPDLIILAGWMHVFTRAFLEPIDAEGIRIINLHPALPGQYDGANAIQRAYDDFQAGTLASGKTGIMVHFVTDVLDRGPPIMTVDVPCKEGEELFQLEQRIHDQEHELIVAATQRVAKGIFIAKRAHLARNEHLRC